MEPRPWPEPASEVARAVRAKNYGRAVPLPVAVRDRLGELFPDAEFAEAFGSTGPAGWSPGRLALITVFQMAENLTDWQAAEAVRDRLSWMYALGLGLEDTGFDFTVLYQFRARVVEHGLEEKVLDLLLARLSQQGLLATGGKQRTDSTHVISAVRDLSHLELAGESVRAAVEALAVARRTGSPLCWTCLAGRAAATPGSTPGATSSPLPTGGTASCCWPRCSLSE
ncbi:transposase [Streptomyces cinereoruber]|uniref:transposase n=1 Tax=Streptomyces cinereoruber TaxID=67260 RepID=UPI003643333C